MSNLIRDQYEFFYNKFASSDGFVSATDAANLFRKSGLKDSVLSLVFF